MPDPTEREKFDQLARQLGAPWADRKFLAGTIAALHAGRERAAPDSGHQLAQLIASVSGDAPLPIGIWLPERANGEIRFRRDPTAVTRHWWPPHEVLHPKKSLLPLRVCVLGESTSAGWFYAPIATPAKYLQGQLDAIRGKGLFEVLDLSMINLQPRALVELTAAVTQLAPDIVVIFAGNNWAMRSPTFPGVGADDIAGAVEALQSGGVAGLSKLAQQRTAASAAQTIEAITQISDAFGLPVVLVVPEVNLRDWQRSRPAAWLPGDASRRWHSLHEKALAQLASGDQSAALESAEQMLALDGCHSPAALELKARAELSLGRMDSARASLEEAVNARTWDNFPSVPSATPLVQAALRAAAQQGIQVVDLPQVFRSGFEGGLPDRRMFLDYCHLTLEGMRQAAAAISEAVLELAGPASASTPGRQEIASSHEPDVPPAIDAQVKFMSMLYGAHYGSDHNPITGGALRNGNGISEHWLREARHADADIDTLLFTYIQSRIAPLQSFNLSAEQQSMHDALTELEGQTSQTEGLDADLVTLILEQLRATHPGACESFEAALIANHAVEQAAVDLCSSAYHWSLAELQQGGGGYSSETRALLTAPWPCSHFSFVATGEHALQLRVIARLPLIEIERQATLELRVNDQPLTAMDVETRWTHGIFRIDYQLLRKGYNKLTLHWPELPDEGDAALQRILERLQSGIPVDLHPVFGELHALRIGINAV